MIGKVIFDILSNDAEITAIVPATKIRPYLEKEDKAYPYIVYEEVNQDPTDTKDGKSCLDIGEFDIIIYSKTLGELNDLGIKVRNALDRFSGTSAGVVVQSVKLLNTDTDYSDDPDRIYAKGQSYSFRFETIYNTLGKPANLIATGMGSTQIDLAWSDNSTGETGYEVWKSTDAISFTLVASLAAESTSYSDTGLTSGDVFSYKVRAINADGGGCWSNIALGATTTISSGIAYQRPFNSGQTVSYRTYDDAWQLTNNIFDYTPPVAPASFARLDFDHAQPFLNLVSNNAFGNKDRFTDSVGGQDYDGTGGSLVDYLIDHLTGLGWHTNIIQESTWDNAIDNSQAATYSGFSDWYLPPAQFVFTLFDQGLTGGTALNYAPFSFTSGSLNWTSATTRAGSTTNAKNPYSSSSGLITSVPKTQNANTLKYRVHYT